MGLAKRKQLRNSVTQLAVQWVAAKSHGMRMVVSDVHGSSGPEVISKIYLTGLAVFL
jgi:hypothetical protein